MANIFRQLSSFVSGRFSLQDVPGFPYDIYSNQLSVYTEAENWFKGYALEDQITGTAGTPGDLYPLRINPLISTVYKHAYTLFGETVDDGRPLVYTKMIAPDDSEEAAKLAKEAEDALNFLWWENNGRALLFENGILSQVYGGCVFKATYVPWEWDKYGGWRRIPIRIERVHPKSFIGRPSPGDMYRLSEAWITSDIPADEARKWGYTGFDDNPTFVEKWSIKEHRAWINTDPISLPAAVPDNTQSAPENPFNGLNPFGLVPMVYIPHVRAGEFHGQNVIDTLKGLVKEMNLRFGDYGDAVNDDSHATMAMRNITGSPQYKRIADGLKVLDLGSSANVTGTEAQPDIFEVHKMRASAAMKDLLQELINQYRRDSFVPAVAEGEDEGSQRSALTLATRFWPLTSHVGTERIFFSAGLDVFQSLLLKMMANKDMFGMTEAHTKMRMKQSWAPMLPRDREAEVQEWSSRMQNDLGSIEHMLDLTRDVDNVPQERERILEWMRDVAEIQAEAAAKAAQKFPAPTPSVAPGKGKTTKPEKTVDQKHGGGGGKK